MHFSAKALGYISAYRCVCKSDDLVLHSTNHPDLQEIKSPRTKTCMAANSAKRRNSSSGACGKSANEKSTKNLFFKEVRLKTVNSNAGMKL